MEHNVIWLNCLADDFCQLFMSQWNQHLLTNGLKKRHKPCRLTPNEIMCLFIYFHKRRFHDLETYYIKYIQVHLAHLFPRLVS